MSYLRKAKMSLPVPVVEGFGGDRLGWVQMSKRDLQRIEVLTEVLSGRRTTTSAAVVLDVSVRQTQRLLTKYRDGGGAASSALSQP